MSNKAAGRRVQLIAKKYTKRGLTSGEESELEQLEFIINTKYPLVTKKEWDTLARIQEGLKETDALLKEVDRLLGD